MIKSILCKESEKSRIPPIQILGLHLMYETNQLATRMM